MLFKIGKLNELACVKERLPPPVYEEAYGIVKMLDEQYGLNRDIDTDDGGYVLFADTADDLLAISGKYFKLCEKVPEHITRLKSACRYINALFIINNEFGVNIIMPEHIAPSCIFKGIEG